MACILLRSSALRVHDSQAYMKKDVTREHISCSTEPSEMLLSFQTGFNLVNAVVVCAILDSVSDFEPSSVIFEPRYFKLVTVLSFLSIYFNLRVNACGVVISLVFLAQISMSEAHTHTQTHTHTHRHTQTHTHTNTHTPKYTYRGSKTCTELYTVTHEIQKAVSFICDTDTLDVKNTLDLCVLR